MIERLDQESASATCRIEHGLAKPRIRHFHHEPDQRSWRVELAGIASGVTHLLQHRLVEMTEGVNFFRGTEVYTVDFVHDLPKQEATVHPVNHTMKDVRNHVPLILAAVRSSELTQVFEQALTLFAVRRHSLLVVDKMLEFIPADSVFFRCPIPPAVRGLKDRKSV